MPWVFDALLYSFLGTKLKQFERSAIILHVCSQKACPKVKHNAQLLLHFIFSKKNFLLFTIQFLVTCVNDPFLMIWFKLLFNDLIAIYNLITILEAFSFRWSVLQFLRTRWSVMAGDHVIIRCTIMLY